MNTRTLMRKLARWHIWLGWLIGVPLLLWTLSGFVMVLKPIEEVRGNHLRKEIAETPLPRDTQISVSLPSDGTKPVRSVSTQIERGEPVTRIIYLDGTSERFRADGNPMAPLSEIEARLIVAETIVGGDQVIDARRFDADDPPRDFRRPEAVWQVALADGTHVYVGIETGEIEAVRTRWWRIFDFMWSLHIMDLQEREDTSHPTLVLFTGLALLGTLIGMILLFRRRRSAAKQS
ncbi:hypothetical protein E3U23_04495 [Erythrobacter litoralis]|uniref:PepSY domain-containing protein n=1 Tax=Erythrobacter litoralis TaxID=39960 RepID=UPI0024355B20|nr:PepSY domain-containing protein [Erythrobacter litoralis]MDG6078450.1 hypothetical protein [Erythrobacter litoralis]